MAHQPAFVSPRRLQGRTTTRKRRRARTTWRRSSTGAPPPSSTSRYVHTTTPRPLRSPPFRTSEEVPSLPSPVLSASSAFSKNRAQLAWLDDDSGSHQTVRPFELSELTFSLQLCGYDEELKEMEGQPREEYIGSLRRRSSGFSRGVSKYRGVARFGASSPSSLSLADPAKLLYYPEHLIGKKYRRSI